ncbi:MAG: elongation factor G [Deltaproteobacteria bacterium]|nr:elongation factor G [Deltaproteobacteria bacterium]
MTTTRATLHTLRNIGISAHVDAGKTTLTERILFYCGRIHRIGEVHDKLGKGATMDSTKAEKAHGITIKSAATRVTWREHAITIIDTPGHADFTIEVERALRVLDGAVFVFSAVEGVQAQSIAVDRQMRRHGVPRIAFINKMDRVGARPEAVVRDICEQLGAMAVPVQLPLGVEASFDGVIDLVELQAIRCRGEHGERVELAEIPSELVAAATAARERLIDVVSRHDDALCEAALGDTPISTSLLRAAIRRATLAHLIVPVLFGSAFRNQGVQPLLDAVVDYLPDPGEVRNLASSPGPQGPVDIELIANDDLPVCAFVFKLDETRFGTLGYVRVYQGTLTRGGALWCPRTRTRIRVGRLLRLHPDDPTAIDSAQAGEIVGLFGAGCESGDTLCGFDPRTGQPLALAVASFEVPEPIVSRTIEPKRDADLDALDKALARFSREDPSLVVGRDATSGQTLISGTGILQLEIYAERLADEHELEVRLGAPQVAYRETVTAPVEFDHLHRKQSGGGSGQYAGVRGFLRPSGELDTPLRMLDSTRSGSIPRPFLHACEQGVREALQSGPLVGAPVMGVEVELVDGKTHPVDSSDLAFQLAARDAVRAALRDASPRLLEPVMRVEVDGPRAAFGAMGGSLLRRRGQVIATQDNGERASLVALVPLAEMFDYAADLAGITGGRAAHAMTMHGYAEVPEQVANAIVAKLRG